MSAEQLSHEKKSEEESMSKVSSDSKSKALLSFLKSSPAPVRPDFQDAKVDNEAKPKTSITILKREAESVTITSGETIASRELAVNEATAAPAVKKAEKRRKNKTKGDNSSSPKPLTNEPVSKEHVSTVISQEVQVKVANAEVNTVEPIQTVNRSHQLRTTRNQIGKLIITPSTSNAFRPNQGMTVTWELPETFINSADSGKVNLVIGLSRFGSAINSPCIIAKQIGRFFESFTDSLGQLFVRGKISFYAPRSAGRFAYRLFDQSSTEKSRITLATSSDYFVELDEPNLDFSLKFVHDLFEDKKEKNSPFKAVSQFTTLIESIRPFSLGRGPRAADRINKVIACIDLAIQSLIEHGKILDAALEIQPNSTQQSPTGITVARKIHLETFSLFTAVNRNRVIKDCLPKDQISAINNIMSCYCKLLQRFFSSMETLQNSRKLFFLFHPASSSIQLSNIVIENLNSAIIAKISSLIPSVDFEYVREGIRRRIHDLILQSNLVPPGTTIELYGSSKNNFGNSSSDVDMCILFPPGYSEKYATPEDRGKLMEVIGNHLIASNMLDVQIIATARIPVVNFRDPVTGE